MKDEGAFFIRLVAGMGSHLAVRNFIVAPAAGSPWFGWSGGVVSKSQTISVTANFK